MPDLASDLAPDAPLVLVVDDDSVNRRKLSLAARALGMRTVVAGGGAEALCLARGGGVDVVLLDLLMPAPDGFAVLATMRTEPALHDLPVIVVTGIEHDAASIARAIDLGAVDVLPKTPAPAILRARLDAALAARDQRAASRAFAARLDALAEVAGQIEDGAYDPAVLPFEAAPARDPALHRLTETFRAMAQDIYARELRLHRAIRTLHGGLLVLATGAASGLLPSLSRLAAADGLDPLAMAVWVNVVAAAVCLAVAASRGRLPTPTPALLAFVTVWALVAGVLYRLAMFVVAERVDASMIALVGGVRGFIVIAIAAALGLEVLAPRRLLGLGIGFAGVAAAMLTATPGMRIDGWLVAALALPLLLAIQNLLLARRAMRSIDPFGAVGMMMTVSAVMTTVLALGAGRDLSPAAIPATAQALVVMLGLATAASVLFALCLVIRAGPVFASQTAYSTTILGIVWAMLLLGEALPVTAWAGVGLIVLGIWLVEPARADEGFRLRRVYDPTVGRMITPVDPS